MNPTFVCRMLEGSVFCLITVLDQRKQRTKSEAKICSRVATFRFNYANAIPSLGL